ncbi:hypothetical protein [Spirosoma radiotolerans]|uniref:Uncharacterized protein n=1 Tax=Spirosoma radiotolerans TaxID=1379870 RepID=A0A0E3ZU78_9BACT|nr:hypothetical protein [Spirosoma radiotolerans]AKD55010.1 hypothetical protein SD10_08945 [Spirosoma radiotolerans]
MTDLLNTVRIEYDEESARLTAIVHCTNEKEFREDIHLKLMYTHYTGNATLFCHGVEGNYLLLGTYEINEADYAKQIEADIISGTYPYLTLLPND